MSDRKEVTLTHVRRADFEARGFVASVHEHRATVRLRPPVFNPDGSDWTDLAPEDAHAVEVVLFAARSWLDNLAKAQGDSSE